MEERKIDTIVIGIGEEKIAKTIHPNADIHGALVVNMSDYPHKVLTQEEMQEIYEKIRQRRGKQQLIDDILKNTPSF